METAEEMRYLILAVQREGNRMLAAELRPLGLTPSQGEVLSVLARHQPLTLTGLGELLVCESGTNPSRLVDRLVQSGLVQRVPGVADRRQIALSLTTAGKRLAKQVSTVEARLHETIARQIAGRPVKQTIAVLRALAADSPAGQALERRRHAG